MRLTFALLLSLFILSCSKNHNSSSGPGGTSNPTLSPFTVTVIDRGSFTAVLQWDLVQNLSTADTVKYKIKVNGRLVDSNLTKLIDTIHGLSADTAYNGLVYAYTKSGAIISAPFFLEQLNGFAFFGDLNGVMYCVDIYSGNKVWQSQLPSPFLDIPTVINGVIYLNSSESGVWAFNSKTGQKLWNTTFSTSNPDGNDVSPLYANGNVYTAMPGGIYSLRSTDGSVIWSYPTTEPFAVNPVVAGTNLIAATLSSQDVILALDLKTGKKVWEDTLYSQISKNPVVFNNLVIFGAYNGKIYALDAATGKQVWIRDLSVDYRNYGAGFLSPLLYKNTVIVNQGNRGYYALNAATGDIIWNYPINNPNISSPAIGNNMVYFSMNIDTYDSSVLIALDATTGKLAWQHTLDPYGGTPTPICVKNRLYFSPYSTPYGWATHIVNAHTGAPITDVGYNGGQWSGETIVDHDTAYYPSASGMLQ